MRRLDGRVAKAAVLVVGLATAAFLVQKKLSERSKDPFAVRLIESTETERAPFSAKCDNPVSGLAKFRSRASTPSSLARHLGLIAEPERLARQHVKYMTGFFHFSEYAGIRVNTLSNSRVEVISQSLTRADEPVTVDSVPDDASLYPIGFFDENRTKRVRSFVVEYEATIPVVLCQRAEKPTTEIEFDLPKDPYLAFWYVPAGERREVQWGPIKTVTNPCAYEQMADLKKPSFYWYVWNPLKKGSGFDCRSLIGRDRLLSVRATFEPIVEEPARFSIAGKLKDTAAIRVSIIFGLLGRLGMDETAEKLQLVSGTFGTSETLPGFEPGVQIGNGILNLLRKLATLEPWSVRREGTSFIFTSRGQLKESKREIEIEAFVGPTVDYQKGTKHWTFLANALRRSQFIFYNGHAGMGSTFAASALERETGVSFAKAELPAYQFIAPLSCFGTDYFGHDFAELRAGGGRTTDLILPGFEGHSFMMIPAVLQYVDGELAGRSVSLKKSMERFLSIDQPIHLLRR